MGYEVNYQFYNKIENSFDYDRENPQSLKKTYGKWNDDFPLDKLAASIMQQMARRDIFVFDLEIYEFQKKKISFKQNKSDLIIKNKKFSNKGDVSDVFDEENINLPLENKCHPPEYDTCNVNVPRPSPSPTVPPTALVNLADRMNLGKNIAQPQSERIIKKVSFMPSKMANPIGNFTIEKIYPVYRETFTSNGIGLVLETVDDLGRRVKVPDEHFVPAQQSLVGGDEINFGSNGKGLSDDGLNWNGAIKDSVPKLR